MTLARLLVVSTCLSLALTAPAAADTVGSGVGPGQPYPPSPDQTDSLHHGQPGHNQGQPGEKPNPDLQECLKGEGFAGFIAKSLPDPFKGVCQHFTDFAITDHSKHSIGVGEKPQSGDSHK